MRAGEIAHILDDAQNRHADLLEHMNRFARVLERDVGRCGDDDGTGERRGLNQDELYVAGAGRQIDDEVIEVAPVDIAQELLNDAVEHRAAPDQRLVAGIQKPHRHDLHAVFSSG